MRYLLTTFICAFFLLVSPAQSLLRFVGTSAVTTRIGVTDAAFNANHVAIEQQTQDFMYNGHEKPVIIPVVFHVLFTDSVNVTAEQINCQLQSLNEDFSGLTFKIQSNLDLTTSFYDSLTLAGRMSMFSRASSNTNISFCLAQTNDLGQPTTGVEYLYVPAKTWTWDDGMKKQQSSGLKAWDGQRYLNIWVCQMADSVSCYAQMPGGPWETDGIVIDHRFFGCGSTVASVKAPFNKGKTLTHLIGNYLNLYDLWSYYFRCQDDNVSDTPVHNAPTFGCDHYRHISTCDGQPDAMTMNFMDNSDDACLYMFTNGQVTRMQAVLAENGWRSGLTKAISDGLSCSVAPLTDAILPEKFWQKDPETTAKKGVIALNVDPNPAHETITVSMVSTDEARGWLRLTNATGKEMYKRKQTLSKGVTTVEINCSTWTPGVYFVVLTTNGKPYSRMVIVN